MRFGEPYLKVVEHQARRRVAKLLAMVFVLVGAALLNAYATVLVLARAVVYRTQLYRPMLLNIGLSIAPIALLLLASASAVLLPFNRTVGTVAVIVLGLLWLLMLPNASYLITELNQSHRSEDDPVPMWFDIILVITLAMSGVINTVVNVFLAHLIFVVLVLGDEAVLFAHPSAILVVSGVLLLVGLGMYLGRYLRVNSWDVRHPSALFAKVRDHFSQPGTKLACAGFSLTYAVFLGLMYLIIVGPLVWGLHLAETASLLDG